jgi:hypothetical protein
MADVSRNLLVYPNLIIIDSIDITVRIFWPITPELMEVTAWQLAPKEEKGELLAQVDPRPFAIQLHQAQATLMRDNAQLRNAKANISDIAGSRDRSTPEKNQPNIDGQCRGLEGMSTVLTSGRKPATARGARQAEGQRPG